MPNKIIVNVTAADISLGQRADCEYCPVASALSRKINRNVKVFSTAFGYRQPRTHRWIFDVPLPEKVSDFINAFDAGRPVRPFRFTINRLPRYAN